MYCSSCGAQVSSTGRFCSSCGGSIDLSAAATIDSDEVSALGNDEFASALIDSAENSKLTPAAPGWASVESANVLEEFFSKIGTAPDLDALAKEYNAKITPMLNSK